MYPLKFHPIVKDKIWGGHKLQQIFGKEPAGLPNIGESWELSGYPTDASVVANGYLAGKTLPELIEKYGEQLVGKRVFERFGNTFPLLFKLIDANDDLSIQVHPNDETAGKRHNSFGKTEMWYVLHAEPEASLIIGFTKKCTKKQYLEALEKGEVETLLQKVPVQAGDVFFIPAGLVHAIGKGVVIAEIQQTSDITYRLYDFDRVDAHGNTRELHIDLALDAINYKKVDTQKQYTKLVNQSNTMVDCPYFTTNYIPLQDEMVVSKTGESFTVYMVVDGCFSIDINGVEYDYQTGDTVLVPAALQSFKLNGNASLLEIYIS